MKLIDKVNTYKALKEMLMEEWPFDFAYKITQLMRFLEPEYQFFSDEEIKLVARFGMKDDDGRVALNEDGTFNFISEEDRTAYIKRINELKNTEMDVEEEPKIAVTAPEHIRGDWLFAIEPFFDFTQEGGRD